MTSASVNILIHAFWYIYVCILLRYIPRSGIILSLGKRSDHTNLHSHLQYMRVLVALNRCQHLLLSIILILDIVVGV